MIDAAIDSTVTDAIESLFGDSGLWDALQSAVVSLVGEILGDSSVQSAIGDRRRRWSPPHSVAERWVASLGRRSVLRWSG